MKRPNITPGPWKEIEGFISGKFSDGRYHDVCDPRCAPFDDDDVFAEMNANAQAIAAVPDLLEALELARDLIAVASSRFPKSIKHRDTYKLCLADAVIGRALAKAGYTF